MVFTTFLLFFLETLKFTRFYHGKMTLHKPSGNARVRIPGKDYYLGKWNSPEATTEYKKIITQFTLGNLEAKNRQGKLFVGELVILFLQDTKTRYLKNGRLISSYNLHQYAS